jgi:hypothetical protein
MASPAPASASSADGIETRARQGRAIGNCDSWVGEGARLTEDVRGGPRRVFSLLCVFAFASVMTRSAMSWAYL